MKQCCRCLIEKAVDDFGINRATSDGRQYACKICIRKAEMSWSKRSPEHKAKRTKLKVAKDAKRRQEDPVFREYRLEATRKYRGKFPERVKVQNRSSKLAMYGLSDEAYNEMRAEQNGLCALCKKRDGGRRGLFVDHDHETGEVRGLLCHSCNTGLGMLGDNVAGLEKAIAYLQGRIVDSKPQHYVPLTFVA